MKQIFAISRHLTPALILATIACCAITHAQSDVTVAKLKEAVNERHNAVEDAFAAAFEMMNAVHTRSIGSGDTFYYLESDEDDSLINVRIKDIQPDLTPNYSQLRKERYPVEQPTWIFDYYDSGDEEETAFARETAEGQRDALLEELDEILDSYDGVVDPVLEFKAAPDPVKINKAYWDWWVGQRKSAIENGGQNVNERPDFSNQTSQFQIGATTQNELDTMAQSLDEHLLHITTVRNSAAGAQVTGWSDWEEFDSIYEDWFDYNNDFSEWSEDQSELLSMAWDTEASLRANKLSVFLNSDKNKLVMTKSRYLKSIKGFRGKPDETVRGFFPCGAPFVKAEIDWVAEPTTFENNLKVLNQIAREVERLSPFFVTPLGDVENTSFINHILTDGRNVGGRPLTPVTVENYQQEILRIARRLEEMQCLAWPALIRSDNGFTESPKSGEKTLRIDVAKMDFFGAENESSLHVGFEQKGGLHLGGHMHHEEDEPPKPLAFAHGRFFSIGTKLNGGKLQLQVAQDYGSRKILGTNKVGRTWHETMAMPFAVPSQKIVNLDFKYEVEEDPEAYQPDIYEVSGNDSVGGGWDGWGKSRDGLLITASLPGGDENPVPMRNMSVEFKAHDEEEIRFNFEKTDWLPEELQDGRHSGVMNSQFRLVCYPEFENRFKLPDVSTTTFQPSMYLDDSGGACRVVFPVASPRGAGGRGVAAVLNLSHGEGNPDFITHPFWGLLSLEGDLASVEVKSDEPLRGIAEIRQKSDEGFEVIDDPSRLRLTDTRLPVGNLISKEVDVEFAWDGPYSVKVSYKNKSGTILEVYTVRVAGSPDGLIRSEDEYPASHAVVKLLRGSTEIGILKFTDPDSGLAAEEGELWSHEDVASGAKTLVVKDGNSRSRILRIDGEETTTVSSLPYGVEEEIGGYEKGVATSYANHTFGHGSITSTLEEGDSLEAEIDEKRISVFHGEWPPADGIVEFDTASQVSWVKLPSRSVFEGAGWERDGEVREFGRDGSLERVEFTLAGLPAVWESTRTGDSVIEKVFCEGMEVSQRQMEFQDGGKKIVVTENGATTTTEYYDGSENSPLPWHPQSVQTRSGTTVFIYTKVGDGGITVKSVHTPSGGGPVSESVVAYTGMGAIATGSEKIGTTQVSTLTAEGHSLGFLGQPTSLNTSGGGLSRTVGRQYTPQGQVKELNHGNGRIDKLQYDSFGRLAGGSSFDEVSFSPSYSGLNFSANMGGKNLSVSRNIEGELLTESSSLASGFTRERVGDTDDYTLNIPGQGNRGNTTSFLPDGALDSIEAGLDSPGLDVDYGVEAAGGYNCITVKTTVLDAGGGETPMWEKRFTNGYGQLMRVQRPHPSGQGMVKTDYSYNVTAGTVTIQPPAPARPIVMIVAPDGSSGSLTKHGQTYSFSTSMEDGVVTEKLMKGTRTLSKTESEIASGETRHFDGESATPAATVAVSTVGNPAAGYSTRVQVTGRHGDSLTYLHGKDGIQSLNGQVGGESFGLTVTKRDKFGTLLEATIDPAGATGPHTLKMDEASRPLSLKGPAVDLSFQTTYPDGGVKVAGNDSRSGDSFVTRSDATGHPRESRQPGKAPLSIGGEVWSGETTLSVIGLPNQSVTFTNGPTGALLSKERNDGSGETYELHDDGSIDSLVRFDGGGTEYAFTFTRHPVSGEPTGFTGADSSLSIVPNDEGDPGSITYQSTTLGGQAVSHTVNYPFYEEGNPVLETHGGLLAGYSLEREYDPATGELSSVALYSGGQQVHQVAYTVDGSGRLHHATAPGVATVYAYGPLTTQATVGAATTSRTLAGDGTGRIASVATRAGPGRYESGLSYTTQGVIRQQTLSAPGRSDQRWSYDYENGQLQRARVSAGPDFDYDHDDLGNRSGLTVNTANQYQLFRSMTGSGFTVAGSVAPGAEVYVRVGPPLPGITLGGVPVAVNGDGSFRAQFSYPATADPASVPVKVVAVLPGAGTNGTDAVAREDRVVVLPPGEGVSTYGPHGALAGDPRWTYHWNAEGRLIGMETRDTAVAAGVANVRLSFAYDAEGRRIWKKAEHLTADGTGATRTVVTKFVYDGWLLLGEFWTDTVNGPGARYYTWGNDLSGSREGAGGVGGLLAITEAGGGTYTPAYDVAGAIVALVDTTSGAEVAYWKRGPFGELLESGGATEKCPMGFATHYTDEESGLVYFGHRFYSPATGRWLSREPLGEIESFNLYAYCHNDPVGKVDVLGLEETPITDSENPITRLADGSLVVNEVMLISPDFLIWRKPHIDRSRTRQRPMANGDYRMWQEDGSTGKWGPTNYNRSLLALGQGVANSGAREVAVGGTMVVNAATAAFAAPVVVSSGGAVLAEGVYAALAAGGTQLAQASAWVSAAGATVSAGYQRMYPLLNRVAHNQMLHSIASDGQQPALARPGPWRFSLVPASYERVMPVAPVTGGTSGVVAGLRNRGAFNGMTLTGETGSGVSRTSAQWRGSYGPAAVRRHHLAPQELLQNPAFMDRMRTLGYADEEIVSFINRQISDIPNVHHMRVHAEGWNNVWSVWLRRNPSFDVPDIQAQIRSMIREFEIPKAALGGGRYGR